MEELLKASTSYEPFSRETEYVEANRGFVQRQPLQDVTQILDLACGAGTVSALLLEAAPQAHLNGIDLDPAQIDLARAFFERLGYVCRPDNGLTDEIGNGKPVLRFGVGGADDLDFAADAFDCATIANAIHLMPDVDRFLKGVHRVLRPHGVFGFNTCFYAGTFPAGTERWYYEWLREAVQWIEAESRRRVAAGGERIRRVRGRARKAFEYRWSSPEEWTAVLQRHGFHVHDVHQRPVIMDERCFAAVGAYGGLAEVLLSGYPVESASAALQASAGPAFERFGTESIPRHWLEIWATRT